MEKKVYSVKGEELRTVELNDDVFAAEYSEGSVYYAIRNENANKRVGTACTKTLSEVKGSTSKPWKQKGTGRARSGRRRSPVWVGGGTVFGPKPRDYRFKLNKKVKSLARKSALTYKAKNNAIVVVEDFSMEAPKTKEFITIAKNLKVAEGKLLLVLSEENNFVYLSARNLPKASVIVASELNTYKVLDAANIVLSESSIAVIEKMFNA